MARTVIPVQRLQTLAGQAITYQNFDQANGMQVKNLGIQVVLVRAGSGVSGVIGIPSVPDPFNRLGDINAAVAQSTDVAFGPFTVPTNFGDGASTLFINGTNSSGTMQIAVIEVG